MKRLISISKILTIIFIIIAISSTCKKEEKIMKVKNDNITDISSTSAVAHATIIDVGVGIEQHGHCWSTNAEPSVTDNENMTAMGPVTTPGTYTSNMSDLAPDRKYYVKAYIQNAGNIVYGDKISFNTLPLGLPLVTTGSVTSVSSSGATINGNINNLGDGALSVSQHGHCWSDETATPTIDVNSRSSLGSRDSTGAFQSLVVGLSSNTLYYIRAYATNDAGTSYGDTVSFTTDAHLPGISTSAVSSITETSAQSGGNVTDDGGATVTARGVCWSTSENPTISDSHTIDGSGTGVFSSNLTGLSPNTTYYVRAYATNSAGTSYGNHVSFQTLSGPDLPSVTTAAVNSITAVSAMSGGNITDDGGADVTARGVCWSTYEYPTLSDSLTTNGSGPGSFESNITGLSPGTIYYVRAYATNSAGTNYGNQVYFTTLEHALPVLTTTDASSITESSASSGGNITDDGGADVTARGVCWSTSENPTLSDPHTNDGNGTGPFTSNITGLSPFTIYYVRAYATNIAGTEYGDNISFKTLWDNSTVTDYDGNVYATVQIGDQVWMQENLRTTHYSKGVALVDGTGVVVSGDYTTKYWFVYDDNPLNKGTYGLLYTWAAAMNGASSSSANPSGVQGACMSGWHIPSDAEWKQLEIFLGMSTSETDNEGWRGTDEGGKLKEAGVTYWNYPNEGATNTSEFTALGGGHRTNTDFYTNMHSTAGFWSTTLNSSSAWSRLLSYQYATIFRNDYSRNFGMSVRCVKN